jgi:hypothetical protein
LEDKQLKKLISAILAAFILAVMAVPFSASAASGSAGLSGPGAIRAGNTITVSFVINGSGIEGAQGTINYDGSKLTLTGTTQKISSAWEVDFNGANFVAYDKQQNSPINGSSTLFSMTFNVNSGLPVGTSIGVSISGGKISDLNGGIDTNPGYSATLAAPLSTNNSLTSMSIDGGTLSPAFDKNTTTYSTSVPFSVAQLNVNAKAEDSGASVSVNSPALTPGGTTAVTVRVTSANGDTKTYTINVARAGSQL